MRGRRAPSHRITRRGGGGGWGERQRRPDGTKATEGRRGGGPGETKPTEEVAPDETKPPRRGRGARTKRSQPRGEWGVGRSRTAPGATGGLPPPCPGPAERARVEDHPWHPARGDET